MTFPPSHSTMPFTPSYPQPAHPIFPESEPYTSISTASSSSTSSPSPSSSASDDSPISTASPTTITSSFLDQSSLPAPHTSISESFTLHIPSPPSFCSVDIHEDPEDLRASARRPDLSDPSLAEEGEATPLLAGQHGIEGGDKWYEGPLFVTGVKFSLLFIIFTGIVVGTFWFGMPKLDPFAFLTLWPMLILIDVGRTEV